jgi:hypothetical protein
VSRRRLVWAGAGILILSLILAFPLRDVLERMVIVPAAYALYVLDLFYKAMPQFIWWILAIIAVLVMFLMSLAPGDRYTPRQVLKSADGRGQVEELASSIRKTRDGIYFKWLVANRLGKLAYNMLLQRDGARSRSVFSPLLGPDWDPSPKMREYLETGLHGSFSDYPMKERTQSPDMTPLDMEVEEAVEFLESQLEARRDRHR